MKTNKAVNSKFMKSREGVIESRVASYFKSRPEVIAVYLIGSYAQGREKRFSDIDLGILLDHKAFADRNDSGER